MSSDGEYAASAAYQGVIVAFGPVEPYLSVQGAEERHILALVRQLGRYGVAVPPNPYVGKIPAPAGLLASATAEATAEIANVAMYDRLLPQAVGDVGMTRALTNLRRASQDMHLPAFQAAAANGGQLTAAQMATLGIF